MWCVLEVDICGILALVITVSCGWKYSCGRGILEYSQHGAVGTDLCQVMFSER